MKEVGVWGFHRNEDDIPVDFFLTAGSIWAGSHYPVSDVYTHVHPVRQSVLQHPVQRSPASLSHKAPAVGWMFHCQCFRSVTRGRGCALTLNTPPLTLWVCVCGCTCTHTQKAIS